MSCHFRGVENALCLSHIIFPFYTFNTLSSAFSVDCRAGLKLLTRLAKMKVCCLKDWNKGRSMLTQEWEVFLPPSSLHPYTFQNYKHYISSDLQKHPRSGLRRFDLPAHSLQPRECQAFVIRELKIDNSLPQRPLPTNQLSSIWGNLAFQYLILMSCQKALYGIFISSERYHLKLLFPSHPKTFSLSTVAASQKNPFLTKRFGLPSFQTPRMKSCLASCLYKHQDSAPYLFPSTHYPAAWLPLSLAASCILPNHLVSAEVTGNKEKPAAVDLPPLGSTCALILLHEFAAYPGEVYGPLACCNNTAGL